MHQEPHPNQTISHVSPGQQAPQNSLAQGAVMIRPVPVRLQRDNALTAAEFAAALRDPREQIVVQAAAAKKSDPEPVRARR